MAHWCQRVLSIGKGFDYGVKVKTTNTVLLEHVLKTILVDADGNIRKQYNTANLNVDEVLSDIQSIIDRSRWTL